jgi:hypothetical protein
VLKHIFELSNGNRIVVMGTNKKRIYKWVRHFLKVNGNLIRRYYTQEIRPPTPVLPMEIRQER